MSFLIQPFYYHPDHSTTSIQSLLHYLHSDTMEGYIRIVYQFSCHAEALRNGEHLFGHDSTKMKV